MYNYKIKNGKVLYNKDAVTAINSPMLILQSNHIHYTDNVLLDLLLKFSRTFRSFAVILIDTGSEFKSPKALELDEIVDLLKKKAQLGFNLLTG